MAVLDKQRTELMNGAATAIQRHTRGWLVRRSYHRQRRAAVTLQARASDGSDCLRRCSPSHALAYEPFLVTLNTSETLNHGQRRP